MFVYFIFLAERRKKLRGGQSPLQDETPNESVDGDESDDYMDEGMRAIDSDALTRISQIISEHATDLELAQVAPGNLSLILNHLQFILIA